MDYPGELSREKAFSILNAALDSIDNAIVTIDSSHRVIFLNKEAERIFGYSREEVIGKDLSIMMSYNCAKDHKAAVKRYLETGIRATSNLHSEIVAVRRDGTSFPAAISFSVSQLDKETYFTAIIADLSASKEMEQRLQLCQDLAGLGRMVAEVTHELKNPLMLIGGFARQLSKYMTDEVAEKKLDIIIREVERLERLIKDLKEYHLVRDDQREEIDLNGILKEVLELLGPTSEQAGVSLSMELDPSPLLILGNRDRIKQAFLNLAQNSLDAADTGGRVHFISRQEGDKALVEIRDNGCGISEAEMKRIFEPFYTTKPKGTGLGLCIVKKIIEQHGGDEVIVESKKGEGTTVKLKFPTIQPRIPIT